MTATGRNEPTNFQTSFTIGSSANGGREVPIAAGDTTACSTPTGAQFHDWQAERAGRVRPKRNPEQPGAE